LLEVKLSTYLLDLLAVFEKELVIDCSVKNQ
jgi:hypothetical protein